MKNYYLLLFLLLGLFGKAQIITIPDANFKTKLLAASLSNTIAQDLTGNYFKIDSNNDNEISQTEALQVGSLYLDNSNIFDLTGIENFTSLVNLSCINNHLTVLNVSSLTQLKDVNINNNDVVSLNVLNLTQLKYLSCSENNIVSLDVSNLIHLELINVENMVSLNAVNANGCTALKNITATNDTQLSILNTTGCPNLYVVRIENCNITTLDFSGKTHLYCIYADSGQLTSLNVSGCSSLYCIYGNGNDLVTLNVSGCSSLYCIYASNNQLTSLNVSGCTSLYGFYADNNNLSIIDISECSVLTFAYLQDNNLVNIFAKNGANESLLINNNPSLQYICVDDNQMIAVQSNLNQLGYSNCELNSYCSFTPGGTFYTIQGENKFDNENDGCDIADGVIPNLKYSITNGTTTGQLISNNIGLYSISVQSGTHTITPILENPSYFNVSPANVLVNFPAETSPFTQNFCITPNGEIHDVEISIIPINPARPGFDCNYQIIYKNKGNQTENGTINLAFDDTIFDFVSTSNATSSQTFGNLNWNYSNLLPLETRTINVVLNLNSPMETPAVNANDILNLIGTITSPNEVPCNNWLQSQCDNVFTLNQTVVNSFDPNDKTCLEGNTISPDRVGGFVHYMIRFENTGTFPAENIVVKDMIDTTKFDVSSLIPLHASHNYVTKISESKVEFIFENINLPFDDANNDGYVAFKIKTVPTLVLGNTFSNSANIYFDYNFPIVTNTATTTIAALNNPSFEFASYFSLYPNPTNNELNINLKSAVEINSIEIYNTIGQLVITQTGNALKVDVSNLKTGNYFIKINTNEGYSTSQFIKE